MLNLIAIIMFFVILTISMCRAVLRATHGQSNKQENTDLSQSRKKKKGEECELNAIMGYDFIQIKTINKEESSRKDNVTDEPQSISQQNLYATGKADDNCMNEVEEDTVKDNALYISSDDLEQMLNAPWPESSAPGFHEMLADHLYDKYAEFEDNDQKPKETEDQDYEPEDEKAMREYTDSIYDIMASMKMSEEDRNALDEINKFTS